MDQVSEMAKEEGVIRVCVALPKFGYTLPHSYMNRLVNFASLGKLEARGQYLKETPRFEFLYATLGDLFTPVAREEAAKLAIEWDCDYLFMIDDDMICPDTMFEQLWKRNVDIVAALAFTRNYPHHPVLYQSIEEFDPATRKDWFKNSPIFRYPKNQLVEVDAVGFGAVLIKRRVLDGVPSPRFMSTCGTGEDIYFCYQAKKHGYRVFSDTACPIGHLSHPLNVTEEYVEQLRAKSEPEFEKERPEYKKYDKKEGLLVLGS